MTLRPRILNLSNPAEYLTPPDVAVHALRLGYREQQPEGTGTRPPNKKKKEGER